MERCFLKWLPSLLSMDAVCDLFESNVQRMVRETPSIIALMKREARSRLLENGLALFTRVGQQPPERGLEELGSCKDRRGMSDFS